MKIKNIVVVLSSVAVAVAMSCSNAAPRRILTGAAGTPGAAGAGNANGAAGAGNANGAAGAGNANGAAGDSSIAGTTGAAGDSSVAGTTGAAGDTSGTAGTPADASTTGAAGTPADASTTGAAGTPAVMTCMNATVVSPGGLETNCTAKSSWVATAMPTPPSKFDGIDNTLLQPQYAIDGNPATRYSSGMTMAPGFYFQVDLGQAKMVSGITVDTSEGVDITDVAQAYEVDLSTDGTNFTMIASCMYPAAPMEVVNFTATMARYVRYKNTAASATGATSWMSIHEFDILCN
jgi:F5/8 type C domain